VQRDFNFDENHLGFLHRLRAGSYHFVEEVQELRSGALYYLFFKESG